MVTLLIFLLVISVLIFVHELGHFTVAKWSGMKVEEFGFGFPPKLWSFKWKGTLYSINAIPFGGFVRIFGEEGESRGTPGSFSHANTWARLGVVVSGVFMNFVLAVVLLAISNFAGLRVGLFDPATTARATDQRIQILEVQSDSPAAIGGLQTLDQILGFKTPEEVQRFAYAHAGERVTLSIRRGSATISVPLTLRKTTTPGQGPIGISLALTGVVRYSWYQSIWRGIADAWMLFTATIAGYWGLLVSLFTTGSLGADIAGPIGIAALTGQAARVGFTYLIQFVAMISVNLAVLNILPFPALDGGRAVLVLVERIRRRALKMSTERTINTIGFAILLALMVAVTVKDVVKFF
jgi:regulator of sigma E protease